MTYTYHREGGAKVLHYEGLRKREAFQLVSEHIYYNGLATKSDAQRFSASMKDGEPATLGPYTFTVTAERKVRSS